MSNDFDLSKYDDNELLSMLIQKQKEYVLLIQTEKIAKMILDYYNEEFYTGMYHSRVNNEYYLLYKRADKKNLTKDGAKFVTEMGIPLYTVITRLEESRDELKRINDDNYYNYARHLDEIIDNIKKTFYYQTILYKDGYLYVKNEDDERILSKEELRKLLENQKKKTL